MVPMISATATRERGDGDVVVDLAHRLGERPAVGEVHEAAVDRVEQAHAGREQDRQGQDRVPGQRERRRAAGEDQQADLGGGVEAEPEQHADRVHVPRLGDRLGGAAEEAVHEAAVVQVLLQLGLVVRRRGASRRNTPRICRQHDQVEDADDAAGTRRTRPCRSGPVTVCRPEESSSTWPASARTPTASRTHSTNTMVEWPRENQKPTETGPLAVGHQLAGGVVDRGDVVGVERVPHAQGVGGDAQPDAEHPVEPT